MVTIHQPTYRSDDVNIRPLVVATDIVDTIGFSLSYNQVDSTKVIIDIEPVSGLLAVTVNGKRLCIEAVRDKQRDKLFRKLIRAIVV